MAPPSGSCNIHQVNHKSKSDQKNNINNSLSFHFNSVTWVKCKTSKRTIQIFDINFRISLHKSHRFAVDHNSTIFPSQQNSTSLPTLTSQSHIFGKRLEYFLVSSRAYCFVYWKWIPTWLWFAMNYLICVFVCVLCTCFYCNLIGFALLQQCQFAQLPSLRCPLCYFLLHWFLTICLRLHVSIH